MNTHNNEKVEILNQINYSNFFNSVSDLVLNALQKEAHNETLLLLMEDHGSPFVFCQSGDNFLRAAKKNIKLKHDNTQTISINGNLYYFISIFDSPERIFVFFQRTEVYVDLHSIKELIIQYVS
ncbi:hypothetical protein, partial [Enterococcus casseliflavus]|uniref:hypothetical protein n=1 Tax=Enterococcus casseliflavus TaxID=37734 RepID=UPI001D16EF84